MRPGLLAAALAAGTAGCAPQDPEGADPPAADDDGAALVEELGSPGPHAVGYRTSEVAYPDPAGGGDRSLRLALWYPSGDASGTDAVYLDLFPAPGVWADARPAAGPMPVAVFSHGHQGFAENSGFLMAHLASHGWLVAAPDHTGNTLFDGSDRTTAIYLQRPLDLSAVLDYLQGLPDGDPIAGAAAAPVVALGHSFGGYTVLAAAGAAFDMDALAPACADGTGPQPFCSALTPELEAAFRAGVGDARIEAVVPMAPGDSELFGEAGLAAVAPPAMLMTGDLDPGADAFPAYWEALRDGVNVHVALHGGGHQTFTDFSGVLETFEGLIDPEEGFRIVDAYALAFARAAAGDASVDGVLDGSVPVSEQATVER